MNKNTESDGVTGNIEICNIKNDTSNLKCTLHEPKLSSPKNTSVTLEQRTANN